MAQNKIVIELVATDEASQKILGATRKIEMSVKGLEGSTKTSLGKVGGMFTSLKDNWIKATAAIAAAYATVRSVSWVWSSFKEATQAGEQIRVFSQMTGMAADEVMALRYAAEQTGAPIEGLDKAITRMVKNTGEAIIKTGDVADAIGELGLDAQKLGKLDVDTQLLVIAKAFETVEDEADQTRIAMTLFGRGGAAMVPLLQQGAAGIQALKNEARELGLTISDDMAKRADEAGDAIQRFEAAVKVLKIELALLAAPGVSKVLDGLVELIKTFRSGKDEAESFGNSVKGSLNVGANPLQQHIGYIQDYINACKEGISWWEKLKTAASTAVSIQMRTPGSPFAPLLWLKDYGEKKQIDRKKETLTGETKKTEPELPADVFTEKKERKQKGSGASESATRAADKAMEIYKELLSSTTLTEQQMETIWEGYKVARLEQIEAEQVELQKLVSKGLDPALIKQITQNRKEMLGSELTALKVEIAKKTVDAEASVYKGLMDSQNLVSTDMVSIWESYKEKRIEQINLEAESMKLLKIDAEAITSYVATQTNQLEKDIEEFTAKYKELRTPVQEAQFEAPVIEKTLTSSDTTDEEWQAAWAQYEEYRKLAIEKELEDMQEAGHDESVILMERKRKYAELYDYIRDRSQSNVEQELSLLSDIASSDSLSAEDRKRVWSAYYEAQIRQIELTGEKLKALGKDAQLVDAWMKTATADVKKEMNKASDEWTIAFDSFTEVIDSSFKSGLSDMFKNGCDDMGDYWQEFLNTMVESWMRAVSTMLINKVLWGSIGGKDAAGAGGGLFGLLNKKEKVEISETFGQGKTAQAASISTASMGTVSIQSATFAATNLPSGTTGEGAFTGFGEKKIIEETIGPEEGATITTAAANATEADFTALQKASMRMEIEGGLISYMPAKETSLQAGFTQVNAMLQSLSSQIASLQASQVQPQVSGLDFSSVPQEAVAESSPAKVRAMSGGMFFPKSNVPRMQSGGVAMTPTNVLIGDTPEIVLPLNRFAGFMDEYEKKRGSRGGKSLVVNYNISTPNVASFQSSRGQLIAQTSQAIIRGRRDM